MEKIKDGKELAAVLSSSLNCFGNGHLKECAKIMARDHRSLQQSAMRFFMMFVAEMAENGSDLRNEASVNLAKKIMAMPERDRVLPFI